MSDEFEIIDPEDERPPDRKEQEAKSKILSFFEEHKEEVFFSRQIEVRFEDRYFHWIMNRAIRDLVATGKLGNDLRPLESGGRMHLFWHRGYRYYRRSAAKVAKIVEEYASPNIAGSIGLHGEMMVLECFARFEFILKGKNTREYKGKRWSASAHNLDFIFEKDERPYGLEVKNTLGYMDHEELQTKIKICKLLGLRPVFVVRMLPKSWIKEIYESGGFALVLKYQLYPWSHKELAARVARELGLPVDAPRVIEDGTMKRFMRWHKKNM